MLRPYAPPRIASEKTFETNALGCGKTTDPPPGSWHFATAYDTFTGHLGGGMGGSESVSGAIGLGWGPGGSSNSYGYSYLCSNWVTWSS